MSQQLIVDLNQLEQTQRLASRLAVNAPFPYLIALNGDLGTGKTQFVRFFVDALLGQQAGQSKRSFEVTSPTYVLHQRYPTQPIVHHFDFYRLDSEMQVWDLGFDEIIEQPHWVLVEWADKFPQCRPDRYLHIQLENEGAQGRRACLQTRGPGLESVLAAIG